MFVFIQKLFASISMVVTSVFGFGAEPVEIPVAQEATPAQIREIVKSPLVSSSPVVISRPKTIPTQNPDQPSERIRELEKRLEELEAKVVDGFMPPSLPHPTPLPKPEIRAEISYPDDGEFLFQLRFFINDPYTINATDEIKLTFNCFYENLTSCNDLGLEQNGIIYPNCADLNTCYGFLKLHHIDNYYYFNFRKDVLKKEPQEKFYVKFEGDVKLPIIFVKAGLVDKNESVLMNLTGLQTRLINP